MSILEPKPRQMMRVIAAEREFLLNHASSCFVCGKAEGNPQLEWNIGSENCWRRLRVQLNSQENNFMKRSTSSRGRSFWLTLMCIIVETSFREKLPFLLLALLSRFWTLHKSMVIASPISRFMSFFYFTKWRYFWNLWCFLSSFFPLLICGSMKRM